MKKNYSSSTNTVVVIVTARNVPQNRLSGWPFSAFLLLY